VKRRSRPLPRITVRDFQKRVRVDSAKVRRIVAGIISSEKRGRPGELTVCLFTDRRIRRLNRDFHGRDCATDVLAFEIGAPGEFLADIVISTDTAAANARRFRTTPDYETYLYLIHGTLHLIGYDDSSPRGRSAMRKKEALYMEKLA
jgi:probable rRNA maturation factor